MLYRSSSSSISWQCVVWQRVPYLPAYLQSVDTVCSSIEFSSILLFAPYGCSYSIKGYFALQFEPSDFILKPHHSKLCIIQLKAYDKALQFKRIPVILEVHHVFDKETQIAQQELVEVESIDDPKWKRVSYMTHMLLQADVTIHLPVEERVNISQIVPSTPAPETPQFLPIASEEDVQGITSNATPKDNTTIIEKLFWEYLSRTNYSRNTSRISKYLIYDEVAAGHLNLRKSQSSDMDKM